MSKLNSTQQLEKIKQETEETSSSYQNFQVRNVVRIHNKRSLCSIIPLSFWKSENFQFRLKNHRNSVTFLREDDEQKVIKDIKINKNQRREKIYVDSKNKY